MQLTLLQTSDYAFTILKHTSDFTVHSIYQKAVNLKAGEQLLTLQPRGSVLSPVSLITEYTESELASFPFIPGETLSISWDTEHLSCQNLFLPDRSLPSNYDIESDCCHSDSRQNILLPKKIRQAIAMAETSTLPPHLRGIELLFNQPTLTCESLYLNAIWNYLKECSTVNYDPAQIAEILCHLIGLGIGLTPSGDDFLCGFLAGLRLHSSSESVTLLLELLCHAVLSHLDRTNEISAAFLRCAACGQFSAPVHLLTDPDITADIIYQAFSRIGHSSGIDTLCGIYSVFYPINTVFPQNAKP